jgi:hypothetical protein
MRCICTNLAGLEAKHSYKVKLKVLTPLNFLTSLRFSITLPSCDPNKKHGDIYCRLARFPFISLLSRSLSPAGHPTKSRLFLYLNTTP